MEEVDLEHNVKNGRRDLHAIEVAARDPLMMEARDAPVQVKPGGEREDVNPRQAQPADPDANAGSDYDAMSDEEAGEVAPLPEARLSIPNSVFHPARILINPRCPTTYAGVSHTQLALDLFGDGDGQGSSMAGKYVLDDWEGAPESFVCQEQRYGDGFLTFGCGSSFSDRLGGGKPQKRSGGWDSRFTMSCSGLHSCIYLHIILMRTYWGGHYIDVWYELLSLNYRIS